mgnify:CR=1 FL=1
MPVPTTGDLSEIEHPLNDDQTQKVYRPEKIRKPPCEGNVLGLSDYSMHKIHLIAMNSFYRVIDLVRSDS